MNTPYELSIQIATYLSHWSQTRSHQKNRLWRWAIVLWALLYFGLLATLFIYVDRDIIVWIFCSVNAVHLIDKLPLNGKISSNTEKNNKIGFKHNTTLFQTEKKTPREC